MPLKNGRGAILRGGTIFFWVVLTRVLEVLIILDDQSLNIQFFSPDTIRTQCRLEWIKHFRSQCLNDPVLQAAYQHKIDNYAYAPEDFQRWKVQEKIAHADTVFEKIEKQLERTTKGK